MFKRKDKKELESLSKEVVTLTQLTLAQGERITQLYKLFEKTEELLKQNDKELALLTKGFRILLDENVGNLESFPPKKVIKFEV